MQRELQIDAFDLDPAALTGDARAQFATWNAWALVDELKEAMDEVGWKPWASSRHFNRELFINEIVDVLHFVGNLLLLASQNPASTLAEYGTVVNVHVLADTVWKQYQLKHDENLRRQREGYTGTIEKCGKCGRELPRVPIPTAGEHADAKAWVYGACSFHD